MVTTLTFPKDIPSPVDSGEGFLVLSRVHNTALAVIAALMLNSSTPRPADANINLYPDSGISSFGERDMPKNFATPSSESPSKREEPTGMYMSPEEMKAEYCNNPDPGVQIRYCYLSQVHFSDGEGDFLWDIDSILDGYVNNGGDMGSLLSVLQQAETMEGFSHQLVPHIIIAVADTTFYLENPDISKLSLEDAAYFSNQYTPQIEWLFQNIPGLQTLSPFDKGGYIVRMK